MTVHTVSLQDQGIAAEPLTLQPAFRPKHEYIIHNRCEHEAQSGRRGMFRRCRSRSVTIINGMKVCERHAQMMRD